MDRIRILIVGLGIGSVYNNVLSSKSHVETVDPDLDKGATYLTIDAIPFGSKYDLAIICTPNHLHYLNVIELRGRCIVGKFLIEKPGFRTVEEWEEISKVHEIYLVKNNIYRTELIDKIKSEMNTGEVLGIDISWINFDRIPGAGSWFTNKKMAFGGVSRDLVPHLLSIYLELFEEYDIYPDKVVTTQYHSLSELNGSGYGKLLKDGVYDVDDFCEFNMDVKHIKVAFKADWKSDRIDRIGITLRYHWGEAFYQLGLCPEKYYLDMVEDILYTFNSKEKHILMDTYIHKFYNLLT